MKFDATSYENNNKNKNENEWQKMNGKFCQFYARVIQSVYFLQLKEEEL
jgi:hypothetical protein